MGYEHQPVLLDEVIEALNIQADGFYIDGTFGRGGHSREILKRLGSKGRLFSFDKDPDAINSVDEDLKHDQRFEIIQGSYTMMMDQVSNESSLAQVNGILLDLGVSSPQFDDPDRGFSFRFDAPLDMRMDPGTGMKVSDFLNNASADEIANVIYEYGEERASRKIARKIVEQRNEFPIATTKQLADLVKETVRVKKPDDIHPATKTFQALRIFINNELNELKNVLSQAVEILRPGGRLAVISFHSLEDRIVKRFIRDQSKPKELPHELPIMPDPTTIRLKPIGKAVHATESEIKLNPRARSAVLRVAERC